MARYRVTMREMLAIEYEVEVEAQGRDASFRVAEDPDGWAADSRAEALRAAAGDGPGDNSETLEYQAMESVAVEEEEA